MSGEVIERESVITRIRSHGRALFWPTLLLIAVAGATAYFSGTLPEEWQRYAVVGAGAVLAVVGWFIPALRWLARNYTITTRRIVVRSGVLVRSRQELLHSRGHDVTVRRTIGQRMFGSGDIRLDLGSGRIVVLRDVPSPDLVHDALSDLAEANQRFRLRTGESPRSER